MDFFGTAMGMATIPMAILVAASVVGGLILALTGGGHLVLAGLVAFLACLVFAALLERIVVAIDDVAARLMDRGRHGQAHAIALLSGMLPVLLILGWEFGCLLELFRLRPVGTPAVPAWLWSYGIATGPWTLFAQRVSRFRRTLCGIRAYAGHLAYWLASAVSVAGAAHASTLLVMLFPAILPISVGLLLAVADRDALTNVRI